MGLFGLGKGIAKVVGGIVTGDGEMIVSGLKKTAKMRQQQLHKLQ